MDSPPIKGRIGGVLVIEKRRSKWPSPFPARARSIGAAGAGNSSVPTEMVFDSLSDADDRFLPCQRMVVDREELACGGSETK
jgi:hypothetical protein